MSGVWRCAMCSSLTETTGPFPLLVGLFRLIAPCSDPRRSIPKNPSDKTLCWPANPSSNGSKACVVVLWNSYGAREQNLSAVVLPWETGGKTGEEGDGFLSVVSLGDDGWHGRLVLWRWGSCWPTQMILMRSDLRSYIEGASQPAMLLRYRAAFQCRRFSSGRRVLHFSRRRRSR